MGDSLLGTLNFVPLPNSYLFNFGFHRPILDEMLDMFVLLSLLGDFHLHLCGKDTHFWSPNPSGLFCCSLLIFNSPYTLETLDCHCGRLKSPRRSNSLFDESYIGGSIL